MKPIRNEYSQSDGTLITQMQQIEADCFEIDPRKSVASVSSELHIILPNKIFSGILKISLTLLFTFYFSNTIAQDTYINLSMKNTSLHEILLEIKQQSGKNIIFNNNLIDQYQDESVDLKAVSLEVALRSALEGKNLQFRIESNVIIIEPLKESNKARKSDKLFQTIKGKVYDVESTSPLIGATIAVIGTKPLKGGITDEQGNFRIEKVPVGRYDVQISYVGYIPKIIPEVLFTTGKEVVINTGLKQAVTSLKDVYIKYSFQKDQPLNPMASISARSFSVEEARRYAGGLDDPARLASSFAGVTMSSIQDNGLVIRGNSTKGILWRLEGISVPNPNHFPEFAVAGGGFVTVFSSQMLANSDFYTGAFPAEYGNALAGVFDMRFRNGNREEREHTAQVGIMGVDVASEGPFKKGKDATYLFNYRYSTGGLLLKILPNKLPLPVYQDLSFKLHFPDKKGSFSIWGMGSLDNMTYDHEKDSSLWEQVGDQLDFNWEVDMGAIGISRKHRLSSKTYAQATVAATGVSNRIKMNMLDRDLTSRPHSHIFDMSGKIIFSSYINHKMNPRISLKTGINHNEWFYDLELNSVINDDPDTYQNTVLETGRSRYIEYFAQGKYNLTPNLAIYGGVNSLYFDLNQEYSIDPRFSLKWGFLPGHTLSFGFGQHSQLEELKIYLIRHPANGQPHYPNKDLKFSRSLHYVLAYDWLINDNLRLKVEPYYQSLSNIPGVPDSYYSLINFVQDFGIRDSMANNSKGENYGIDFTLERFLNNGFYFLITASLYNSQYAGGDGIWRNTRFNNGYVSNILFGKEFETRNRSLWGINGRLILMGGDRFTPVLEDLSHQEKRIYYDYSRAYETQMPATNYLDLTVTYRRNRPKFSSVWALMVKNLLGTPFYTGFYYNYRTDEINRESSVQIMPVLSYKIEF